VIRILNSLLFGLVFCGAGVAVSAWTFSVVLSEALPLATLFVISSALILSGLLALACICIGLALMIDACDQLYDRRYRREKS
jgi:hypothetical protein